MMTILIICAAAVLIVSLLWIAVRGHGRSARTPEELLSALHPVDVSAFRTLTDPDEESYLRANLPPAEFRRLQRARLRAAAAYVSSTAHNAGVLLRLGEAGRLNPKPEIARAARELANGALELRIKSLGALMFLYARIVYPSSELRLSRMFDSYIQVRDGALRFSRLQMPTAASRIEASL